ncbi:MAG TPA: hypothetical protein VJY39_22400 [Acidisphaera sp.]|nr:hypothetical protein [Acidisphaera sp.]
MTADAEAVTADPTPAADQPARHRRPSSPETLRLYAADWAAFEDWCRGRALATLPADPATVAAFLTAGAETLGAGALGRRAAAIAAKHRQTGLASPAADPAVTAFLRAARRSATPRRAPPEQPAALIRMAVRCPRDLAGLRDRALLLLVAGGLGRAALVGLDVEHIRFTATAAEFRPRNAGADGDRAGPIILRRGPSLAVCPVQALRDWLDSSDTKFGPVFRKIDRWGTVEHRRLGTDAIRRILSRRTPRRSRRPRTAAVA